MREGERKGRSEGKRKGRKGEGGSTSCPLVHIIFSTDRASHHRHQPRVSTCNSVIIIYSLSLFLSFLFLPLSSRVLDKDTCLILHLTSHTPSHTPNLPIPTCHTSCKLKNSKKLNPKILSLVIWPLPLTAPTRLVTLTQQDPTRGGGGTRGETHYPRLVPDHYS